jgi:eukaryotic-like serine/threonine-protein kinase
MIGTTLAHYRIEEQIGAGGMGVVYRAHDEQLERDVAVKVLATGTLADEDSRRRFRKEALALAKLNHPNIAIVHEFGNQEDVDFLVTEFIPGVTLDKKLAQEKPSVKEILDWGGQIARGLEAAHEQGVVHRDLKPGNLRLTPDGRLKILDFGLAQLLPQGADHAATLSQSQMFVGTLPYMAPEQLRGEAADARSDIWAAGAVLYEMAAGRRPFTETQSTALMYAIVNREPEAPSSFNKKISPGLDNIILKALAKEPGHRYQSARELGVDLERITAGVTPLARPRASAAKRWIAAAGIFAALLAAGAIWYWRERGVPHVKVEVSGSKQKARRSVAVLGFKNLAGKPELAWLGTALSEMLTTELAAGEELRTVPGENVARMKLTLAPPETNSYSAETLGKIREALGTDEIVLGSYVPVGDDEIRVDFRLQDTAGGETRGAVSEKGSIDQLDSLVSQAGAKLRAKLGVAEASVAEEGNVRASLPKNREAARWYSEGLEKLRVFDYLGAKSELEKAVAAEPGFALSHEALGRAWDGLGYDQKAASEAKKAFELSDGLSREERLLVEARYREANHEWEKAGEIYSSLYKFFPDDLDYGLQTAVSLVAQGKQAEALGILAELRRFPAPQRDDPRIDLTEAEVKKASGDFRGMLTAAGTAAKKAQEQGAVLVVARARTYECMAQRNLGQAKKSLEPCESARQIYVSAGDRGGAALTLNNIGNTYYDLGQLPEAKANYEEALKTFTEIGNMNGAAGAMDNIANVVADLGDKPGARKLTMRALEIYRETGDRVGEGNALNNLAAEYVVEGKFAEATKVFAESLEIWRELKDATGIATSLNNLGEMLLDQGKLEESKARYEEALKAFQDSGQKAKTAYPLFGLAQVLFAEGDLEASKKRYEEIIGVCKETDDKHQTAYALFGLGQVLQAEGDSAGARQKYEESLAMRKEIGETGTAAESQSALAQVALEENRVGDAETLASAALEEFMKEKLLEDEIDARTVLAEVALQNGKLKEARKQIEMAGKMAAKSSFPGVRYGQAIVKARVDAASGRAAEAMKSLQATIAEATSVGRLGDALEARLALGEIEMKNGRAVEGRARLEELEKEAKGRGFGRIAREAGERK